MSQFEKTQTLYTTQNEKGEIVIGPTAVPPTATANGALPEEKTMSGPAMPAGPNGLPVPPAKLTVTAPERTVVAQAAHSGQLAASKTGGNTLMTDKSLPVRVRLDPEWMEVTHLYAAMERYADGLLPVTTADSLQAMLGGASAPSGGPKVVGISSAVRREGKTTVAVQLAINIARNTYKKVALLDLSLEESVLAENLNMFGKGGVVPVLEGRDFRIPTLQMEGLENLCLLPLGDLPKNPVKTAHSPALAEVMAAVREMFDLVIVDLPAVTSGYSLPLINQTDGLLLVVASGVTPRSVVKSAISMVGKHRVIGTILNRTRPSMPKWLHKKLESL
ncbi:MAG: CpsD/CapB family tyrosine-protein kinase [Capsulimonadales bacterium]|nr:CpsD/CapB family tyrosine-protein kinase [Capsulimonadales bacterium]